MNSLETSLLPLMVGRLPQAIAVEDVDAEADPEPGTEEAPAPVVVVGEEEFAVVRLAKSPSVTVRSGNIDRTEKSVDLSSDPGQTDAAPAGTCCCLPSSAEREKGHRWTTYCLDQTKRKSYNKNTSR